MRTINFVLLAVLSPIVMMVGATLIKDGALSGRIARRQPEEYVPFQKQLHGPGGMDSDIPTGLKKKIFL